MLIVWFFAYKKLAQFALRCALPPRRSESPVCATDNKTLLRIASAGLVYWVAWFFLLGTKARILGLTVEARSITLELNSLTFSSTFPCVYIFNFLLHCFTMSYKVSALLLLSL